MSNESPADADQQLVENDLLSEWLGESRFAAQVVVDVDDALSLLARKRTTLEEKIIKKELHTLLANYGSLLERVHSILAEEQQPPIGALEQFRTLNFRVRSVIADLLKALRHSFNFVEQYYEFDFCARLINEYKFADDAAELVRLLANRSQKQ